jgi:hypothetical protein
MTTGFQPDNQTNFSVIPDAIATKDRTKGAKLDSNNDFIMSMINTLIERLAPIEVADITALRAINDYASFSASTTQHITRDIQLRRVASASDGTNTFIGLYIFKSGSSATDADGASSNVDTDGIVQPSTGHATGRWFRIGAVGTSGGVAFVHQDGIEALRTMLKYLYVNLTSGSSDVALKFSKRTAGSQIKFLTDEQIAIRNLADNAYEDLAALAGTFAGAVSGTTGTFSAGVSGTTGTFSAGVSGTTGTFSAGVSGTTGTFSGAVSGTTGSFTGALNMNSQLVNAVAPAVLGTSAPNLLQVQNLIVTNQAFSPIVVPSMTMWLRAESLGNTLVDGDPVSTWSDQSGLNFHVTGAGSVRPLYKTNIINSVYPVVRFDGTNDVLTSTLTLNSLIVNSAFTIFIVAKITAIDSNEANMYDNDAIIADDAPRWGVYLKSAPTMNLFNYDGSSDSDPQTPATATPLLFSGRHSGGTLYTRMNGGSESAGTASGNTDLLSGVIRVGRGGGTGNYFNGDIAEILVFAADISTGDNLRVRNYLNNKYAIY